MEAMWRYEYVCMQNFWIRFVFVEILELLHLDNMQPPTTG